MSVTITEVIEAGGYDLTTYEDAIWLLAQRNEWDELVDKAMALSDAHDEAEAAEAEAEYKKSFPDEENE